MRHDFEQRKQNRIDWAENQAAKNVQQSNSSYKRANDLGSIIPMGQPILVGHHSERRHRALLKRIDNAMRKSVESLDKAKHYANKAEAIENNTAIFSDDPNALDKLREKLKSLEELQALMKNVNGAIRKYMNNPDGLIEVLIDLGFNETRIIDLLTPDNVGFTGYRAFKLTNNNANIRRLKLRIEKLEKVTSQETATETIGEIRIVKNVEANRVQIYFPGIPSEEIRKSLKGRGFRWCRSEGAWQRHLNDFAFFIAKQIISGHVNAAV